jgi:DNA-binding transcriptional ArsR family regulator
MKTVMDMMGSSGSTPSLREARATPPPLKQSGLLRFARNDESVATRYALAGRQCFGYHRSMKSGPDIAMIASLVGDPARANMLTALMNGRALTASELAQEAGITPQTASSHLSKLEAGGLIEPEKQGRHRYYRLTDDDVAGVLEGLAGLAARTGHMRVRTGPKDPALRRARICYDHLAGDLGVQMLDTLRARNLIRQKKQEIELTAEGERFLAKHLQISPDMLTHPRRPVCKACLDWSERRHHLAGTLGAAMMQRFAELKWAARDATPGSRVVNFTRTGEKQFAALFGDGRD